MENDATQEIIANICKLYNDIHNDRVENICPPTARSSLCTLGEDRLSEQCTEYKTLSAF